MSLLSLPKSLTAREEVADAVVGQARLVAAVGQLDEAVVDDDGVAARVDDAIVRRRGRAGEGGGDLQSRRSSGTP